MKPSGASAGKNSNQAGAYGEVLSFTRLENRVLTQTGGGAHPVLDEGGRLLAMYAALKSVQDHLTVYAMPSRRPEFLDSLLTTLDELKSSCVTGAQLAQIGEETEGLDGEKLRDLGLIFGAYEAMTARGPLDPRDKLTRLAEKLRTTPFFQGKDVYLDGFTDFIPQQDLVLEAILRQAHSVTLALTWGGGRTVLPGPEKTIASVKRLAAKTASRWRGIFGGGRPRDGRHPLVHLEANLFLPAPALYEGPGTAV